MKLSIVLCTYNRSHLLQESLGSLCRQDAETSSFEILVVDNNSTDDTRTVVKAYLTSYPNVRYILEEKQGLSHARNRGYQEAAGEYVGYFDDDAKAPSDWVSKALVIIDAKHPNVFGGPYYAFYNTPKPRWFKNDYGSNVLAPYPKELVENEFLTGTNIFFERDLLSSLGGFNPKLGMCGAGLGYGEETQIIIEARRSVKNLTVYYDPQLYVYHLVQPAKMRLIPAAKRHFIDGRYSYRLFGDTKPPLFMSFAKLCAYTLWICYDLTLGVLLRNRMRYPFFQNYTYEHTLKLMRGIGNAYQRFLSAIRAK